MDDGVKVDELDAEDAARDRASPTARRTSAEADKEDSQEDRHCTASHEGGEEDCQQKGPHRHRAGRRGGKGRRRGDPLPAGEWLCSWTVATQPRGPTFAGNPAMQMFGTIVSDLAAVRVQVAETANKVL